MTPEESEEEDRAIRKVSLIIQISIAVILAIALVVVMFVAGRLSA